MSNGPETSGYSAVSSWFAALSSPVRAAIVHRLTERGWSVTEPADELGVSVHENHVDYLHDGHLHPEHDGHYDECVKCECADCTDSCAVCECTDCTCATCNHATCSCSHCGGEPCTSCVCADCDCQTCKHAA